MIPNCRNNPVPSPNILIWKDPLKEEANKPLTPAGLHGLPLSDCQKNEELKVLLSRMSKLKSAIEHVLLKNIGEERKEELSDILSEVEARIEKTEKSLRERREI